MPEANGVGLDQAKRETAKKALAVLRDVVAGDAELEAKCEEISEILEKDSDSEPEYIPFRSEDTRYTIWLNKKNPRNSYYEYH